MTHSSQEFLVDWLSRQLTHCLEANKEMVDRYRKQYKLLQKFEEITDVKISEVEDEVRKEEDREAIAL